MTSGCGSYGSPRWTYEITDCSMPMTFDQYSNCAYRCVYCFATFQRETGPGGADFKAKKVRAVSPEKVIELFRGAQNETVMSKQFGPFIAKRKVLQWGGLSDPFCELERKRGVGLQILRALKELDYPICFSTKGVWWTEDERYVELFKGQKNWNVKVSIITQDKNKARQIEVGCPPPSARLRALERIASWDCGGATLRLRPFIIGASSPGHCQLIKSAGEAGATALSTEFFCVEGRSRTLREHMPMLNELCGFDLMAFYKKHSANSGYMRLNRNVKRPFVDEMEAACREANMRFYVSDNHFKERCANGSCCGLPADWNYSRGQFTEALCIAKRRGEVTWDDITADGEMDYAKAFLWWRANGFNRGSSERVSIELNSTMYDHLRSYWNNPRNAHSPYQMFEGVLKPVRVDENNNVVYAYDKSRE